MIFLDIAWYGIKNRRRKLRQFGDEDDDILGDFLKVIAGYILHEFSVINHFYFGLSIFVYYSAITNLLMRLP